MSESGDQRRNIFRLRVTLRKNVDQYVLMSTYAEVLQHFWWHDGCGHCRGSDLGTE